jgi:hypothetical protein
LGSSWQPDSPTYFILLYSAPTLFADRVTPAKTLPLLTPDLHGQALDKSREPQRRLLIP